MDKRGTAGEAPLVEWRRVAGRSCGREMVWRLLEKLNVPCRKYLHNGSI